LNNQAKVLVQNDQLIFQFTSGKTIILSRGEISFVGEFTTESGPFDEDHFLRIETKTNDYFEIPVSSLTDTCLLDLGRFFGIELVLTLTGSTEFASQAIWPNRVRGVPFFRFEKHGLFAVKRRVSDCFRAILSRGSY